MRIYQWLYFVVLVSLVGVSLYPSLNVPSYTNPFFYLMQFIGQSSLGLNALIELGSSSSLVDLSYIFNYWIVEEDIKGYHVFNSLLHILNAVLVVFLIRHIGSISQNSNMISVIAWCAAGLFLLSGINIQTVSIIHSRDVLILTSLYLVSLITYWHIRTAANISTKKWMFLSAILGLMVVAGVQVNLTMYTVLLGFVFIELMIKPSWLAQHAVKLLFALISVYLMVQVTAFLMNEDLGSSNLQGDLYSNWDYFTHQLVSIWIYAYKFFVPFPLLLEYNVKPYDWSQNATWLALFGHITIFIIAFKLRQKAQLMVLLIGLFYISLLAESSFIAHDVLTSESRMYLPSVFLSILIAFALTKALKSRAWLALPITALVSVGFAYANVNHVSLLQEPLKFYRHNLKYTEDNSRAYGFVALGYIGNDAHKITTRKWVNIMFQEAQRTGYIDVNIILEIIKAHSEKGQLGEARRVASKALKRLDDQGDKQKVSLALGRAMIADEQCYFAIGILNKVKLANPTSSVADLLLEECANFENSELDKLKNKQKNNELD